MGPEIIAENRHLPLLGEARPEITESLATE
jgi:hypothetical protein